MVKLSWVVAGVLMLVSWVVVVVLVLVAMLMVLGRAGVAQASAQGIGAAPVRLAQATEGAPSGGGMGQMSEADRARMREQMIERMLQQANLTGDEAEAAKKALKAKDEARQILTQELAKLRTTANQPSPSNEDLEKALAAYRAALLQYRQKVEAADAALAKQLSLLSQARCLSLGILDNGLGGMGVRGGMGRPGGMGPGGGAAGMRRPG